MSTTVPGAHGGLAVSNVRVYSRFGGCPTCERAQHRDIQPPEHKCCVNFVGSAGSMEAIGVVDMEKQYRNEGTPTNYVVGDDDAEVTKALRDEFGSGAPIKCSDPNHFKGTLYRKMVGGKGTKNFVALEHKLWALTQCSELKSGAAALKKLGESKLTQSIAEYLCANFQIVIKSNRGNARAMADGFKVAVNHAFDDHSGCSKEWCKSLSDCETVRAQSFARLPFKKPLVGGKLKSLLLGLMETSCSEEVCKKLAHGWDSQNNESLHHMFYTKCPKHKAMVSGAVFEGRAHRCIAVKNLGFEQAITRIRRAQGLTPNFAISKYYGARDLGKAKKSIKSKTPDYKKMRKVRKRRMKLANKTLQQNCVYSYSKGVES